MTSRSADADPFVLTLDEVAARTPWSVRTLRRFCRERRIEHERLGRTYGLTPTQLAKLLEQQKVPPADAHRTPQQIEADELAEARAANARPRRAA